MQQNLVENPLGEGIRVGDEGNNEKEVAQFYGALTEKQRPGNTRGGFRHGTQNRMELCTTSQSHTQEPHGAKMANGQHLVSILPQPPSHVNKRGVKAAPGKF